jgi:hypothetical protein
VRLAALLSGLALSACTLAPLPLPTPTPEPTLARTPVPTLTPAPPQAPSRSPTAPAPTDTPEPEPTGPTPTATAEPGVSPEPVGGDLLASFDFSSPGIWGVDETDEYTIAVAGGTMNITVKQPDRWTLTIAGIQADDFLAEVTATVSACSADDSYGLLFRLVDASNFYYFGLGCGARYRVRQYQDGVWHELVEWTAAEEAFLTGEGAENRLAVRAVGDRFQFFANDQYLGDASDSSFAVGRFGLFVSSSTAGGIAAKFDNLQVREAAP